MKIAVNATMMDDSPSGCGIYTLNVIKALSERLSGRDALVVFTGYPEAFRGMRVDIRKVSPRVQPKYGKWAGIFRFLWLQCIFPVRLSREKFDVVFHTTHHAVLLMKIPQIMTIHDLIPLKFPLRYRLQYYYFKYVLPRLIDRCCAVVAVSENCKKDIGAYYGTSDVKVSRIYNGYDPGMFTVKHAAGVASQYVQGKYILVVGASYPHKNLERAIEAFGQIKDSKDLSLLVLGGRREYVDVLKKKTRVLDLEGRVIFMGYVPEEDLPGLYAEAQCLLFPSLYEGFGFPPLEAMACGCPVVMSNMSSLPEVGGDAVYYVDPMSVDSIMGGLRAVLDNESLRAKLVCKGLARAKFFNWNKTAAQMLALIHTVQGRASGV